MEVLCYCGALFETFADLDVCPNCAKPVVVPFITAQDEREMQASLVAVLDAHDGAVARAT